MHKNLVFMGKKSPKGHTLNQKKKVENSLHLKQNCQNLALPSDY
jgi:hypothetical protein